MDMTALGTSLWIALVIGVGFGFFLERAGLGNSVKLAAQFYLRDLTVFKVMFSAIVTAMIGLFALSGLGLVDLARLEVPGTFLWSQLVGGLVFGIGFVVGGYCPGTGCVALSSGRLDGVAVLVGMSVGVFGFGELFPWLRGLYTASAIGPATLPGLLGWPQGVVVGLVALVALVGFVAAERLERRFAPPSGGLPTAPEWHILNARAPDPRPTSSTRPQRGSSGGKGGQTPGSHR
jgi:uncharacterized membrane protein YedE/YeeE